MSRTLSLIKTNLNVNFGVSAFRYTMRHNKKKLVELIFIMAAILMGVGSLILAYSVFLNEMFTVGKLLNQPEVILTMAFMMAQLFVLMFGIFYVMSVFYFSQDLDLLIPLPLRPYEVLGSKFIGIMAYEYLTLLPILIPPLVIYGRGMDQGLLYWLKGILVILASPILPLVLATLFVIVLMRLVNLRKSKDLLAILGGFMAILIAFGFNFYLSNNLQGMDQSQLQNLLSSQMGLIELIGKRFPPSIWATIGITQGGGVGLGNLALFIGSSIILFIFLLWLSNLIFYKGLLSGQEVKRNRKTLTDGDLSKSYYNVSSPVIALFRREWRLLLRTPVYVLNGMGGVIIGPMMVLLMFFGGQQQGLEEIFKLLSSRPASVYYVLIGSGFMLLVSGMNVVASTAISREGKDFWISKMIPVSAQDQIKGKLLHGLVIATMTIITNLIAFSLIFKLEWVNILLIFMLGMIGAILLVVLGLIIDVLRPKLEWTNPQEAVKQNLNALFGILATAGVIFGFFILSKVLLGAALSAGLIYLIFGLISVLLIIISLKFLLRIAENRYYQIEM